MELWDAYDAEGKLAGFDIVRGEKVPEGYYHLVCEAVICHEDGDYLLMQRSFEKEIYPGKWEIGAGGSALKGEDKFQAVKREVREETGIDTGELEEIYGFVHEKHHAIYAGYLLTTPIDKNAVRLQKGETIDYKWISKEELLEHYDSEACLPSTRERLSAFMDSIR